MEILIQPSAASATQLAAEMIAQTLRANPRAVLGLATGHTLEPVYARLAQMHQKLLLDFSGCRTFNLDEYIGLPAADPNSYRSYMNLHLFEKVNIARHNTHLPDGMATHLDAACADYEGRIARIGGIELQLLGIGLNGHIGFNEPPSRSDSRTHVEELSPETIRHNAPQFASPARVPRRAITMGIGTILDSHRCLLLATGAEKADIVAQAVEGPLTGQIPASALQTHFNCTVILDSAAAARVEAQVQTVIS